MLKEGIARYLRKSARVALSAVMLAAVSVGGARAEQQRPTMGQLLDEGFEVRSTTLVTAEMASRNSNATDPDSFIFTLQKGPRLAICYITFNSIFGDYLYANPCRVRQ